MHFERAWGAQRLASAARAASGERALASTPRGLWVARPPSSASQNHPLLVVASCPSPLRFDATGPPPTAKAGSAAGSEAPRRFGQPPCPFVLGPCPSAFQFFGKSNQVKALP